MSDPDIRTSLVNWKGDLPDGMLHVIVAQYRDFVELTDRLSQRRQTVNSFFVTLATAAVAILGRWNDERTLVLVSIAGLILCVLWWRIIKSYRDLNRARFAVIYEMETLLPIRPYTAEWDYVGRGRNARFYKSVSLIEAYVPGLFFLLFLVMLVWKVAT